MIEYEMLMKVRLPSIASLNGNGYQKGNLARLARSFSMAIAG
jgi:hypothetical protein